MAIESKIGHHRSRALAERHLKELGSDWRIASRRSASGAFSSHGHTFVFEREEEEPPDQVFEWLVTFTYDKSGRSFDVIVTSLDETEAVSVAKQFLRDDGTEDFKRIVPSHFHGWSSTPAKGKPTDEDSGNAEYRIDSKTGKIATYNVYKKN